MDEDMDATPPTVARGYGVSASQLVDALHDRLQSLNGGQPFDLPVPPPLPVPAAEGDLRARGEARKRALVVAQAGDDSFLRAAARELAVVDEDAYRRVQRAAVVRALTLCSTTSVDAALAAMGWLSCSRRDDWAVGMARDTTPFDGLALMLWSLLNATSVLVLGREAADDIDFSAFIYEAEEPYEALMVGLMEAAHGCVTGDPLLSTAFVGFARFEHVFAEFSATGRGSFSIQSFGHLSDAAVNTPQEAHAWIGMPRWKKAKGGAAQGYRGDIFIIGDGFKSTRMFRSSVNPLVHCLHTSTVSASYPGGPPLFTVTAADRPDSPLSSLDLGVPWKQCSERMKSAFLALTAEVRNGQEIGKSDYNGKQQFGFTSPDFLREQESKLDKDEQFQLYWERKAIVTAQVAPSTNKRTTGAAGNSGGGAGGSDAGDEAAPRRRAAKRPRRLSLSHTVAGGVGMPPLPEDTALVAPLPAAAHAALGAAGAPIDLTADDGG
jgi:hypothetical protein